MIQWIKSPDERRSEAKAEGSERPAGAAAALTEAERGMAEMSVKFGEVEKELYVSESGEKREAID